MGGRWSIPPSFWIAWVFPKQRRSKRKLERYNRHNGSPPYPLYCYRECRLFSRPLPKGQEGKGDKGIRFIHVFAPCPPGWRFPSSDTIGIGKLAVETGLVVLCEIENGIFHLTSASESLAGKGYLKPLNEYLARQGRYKNLTQPQINEWRSG